MDKDRSGTKEIISPSSSLLLSRVTRTPERVGEPGPSRALDSEQGPMPPSSNRKERASYVAWVGHRRGRSNRKSNGDRSREDLVTLTSSSPSRGRSRYAGGCQ